MTIIKRITGSSLQTRSDFRIELPTGGGWSIWNEREKSNQVFITDPQCGMVCRLYYTKDDTRDKSPTVDVYDQGRYCIYAWWKNINDVATHGYKSGWLTIHSDNLVRADADPKVRSGFQFLAQGIPGQNSYILRASCAGDSEGPVSDLQGIPTTMQSGQGNAQFTDVKSGVIRRRENYTGGGYLVTLY